MARIEKTVFISYRRTDVYTALAVYENLKNQGYDVFFDYRSISSGDFEQIITSNIQARAHFLLILTPTALDRCDEPGDWLRREIEFAIDQKRNIIPLFFKAFRFGDPSVSEKLTGKLRNLSKYNGLNVHEDYFDEAMQRLRTQYLNIPLTTILHPISTDVMKVVIEEQVAADKALEQIVDVKELVKQTDKSSLLPKAGRDIKSRIFGAVVDTPLRQRVRSISSSKFYWVGGIAGVILLLTLFIWRGGSLLKNHFEINAGPTLTSVTTTTATQDSEMAFKVARTSVVETITADASISAASLAETQFPTETPAMEATFTNTPPLCPPFDSAQARLFFQAKLIADITIPDGTILLPGQEFIKTWLIQNIGGGSWASTSTIAYFAGERMSAESPIEFSNQEIKPGECIEISVTMTAPNSSGEYEGSWILRAQDGTKFGFGDDYKNPKPLTVVIVAGSLSLSAISNLGTDSTMTGEDGMTLLYVPAGKFTMGDKAEDALAECQIYRSDCKLDLFKGEEPPHEVYLDAFWVDKTEVMNAMYAQCVHDGKCGEPSDITHYGDTNYANHPVVYVSWNEAKDYCSWANRRLPTEAEWEKAARGTDERTYPWGNEAPNNNLLNYNGAVGDTTEVGKYPEGASPYGVLDMAGNVWEWVADWYDASYYNNSPASNPLGPSSGQNRVLRGDSLSRETVVRSAQRVPYPPTSTLFSVGFRCAMSTTP